MAQEQEQASNLALGLIRVPDVARILSVQPSTVYEWVRMNYIPHVRLGIGKHKPCVRFDAKAISKWIADKQKAGRTIRVPAVE